MSDDQQRAKRYLTWLALYEHGAIEVNWLTGKAEVVPQTTTQIAGLFAVSVRTVQLGLAAAREIRDRLDRGEADAD